MRRDRRAANLQKMRGGVRSIEMQIDELVLHGLPAADRYVIGDAFLLEIEQMLNTSASRTSLKQNIDQAIIDAGRITLAPSAKPILVGKQVARAVYGSLNKFGARSR